MFQGADDFFKDLERSMHDFQGSREHRPPGVPQWFSLSLFPLLGHMGRFPLLCSFRSVLGFAFAVKSRVEKNGRPMMRC